MLVTFSVENFRSFLTEETLSLVASNRLSGSHDNHAIPIPDSEQKVLRVGAIYGANGAGKSNLHKALQYMKRMVIPLTQEPRRGTGRQCFRFANVESAPSVFDLQFIVSERLYKYGFKVDDKHVTEEWLSQVIGNRERVLYERTTDENDNVTIDATGLRASGSEKLSALATVGSLPNHTFLWTIASALQEQDRGEEIQHILDWFGAKLQLVSPTSTFTRLAEKLSDESDFLAFASEYLHASSTGVNRISVSKTEVTEEDLWNLIPENVTAQAKDKLATLEENDRIIIHGGGREYAIERGDKNRFYRLSVQAEHKMPDGRSASLDLNEESDGTKRLLHLLPALYKLRKSGGIFFIDEIDRSLHPNLIWAFLEFFLRSCDGANRQIIFSTHESNLLSLDLLRRDEIWFAEKDSRLATRIYSLADYKVRKDLEIRKHYLEGRFGAIPFLGNLEHLSDDSSLSE